MNQKNLSLEQAVGITEYDTKLLTDYFRLRSSYISHSQSTLTFTEEEQKLLYRLNIPMVAQFFRDMCIEGYIPLDVSPKSLGLKKFTLSVSLIVQQIEVEMEQSSRGS